MPSLSTKYEMAQRAPNILSGVHCETLLDVPSVPIKPDLPTGSLMVMLLLAYLKKWFFAPERSAAVVFDTTTSNTGCKTAACVLLQLKVGRPLLRTPAGTMSVKL